MDGILNLIRRELMRAEIQSTVLSHKMFKNKNKLHGILSGSTNLSDKVFERLVEELRIKRNPVQLKTWLVAYLCYRLKETGPHLVRVAGLTDFIIEK